MRIAVFTGNQPRHISLIRDLSKICDEVFAIQECTTLFPGKTGDFFRKSAIMERYFARVQAAEHKLFGSVSFLPRNVRTLSMRTGDLSSMPIEILTHALDADVHIVFGASWIRGSLIEALVDRNAVNIHMGISPQYRGSSCNFWALYDGRRDLVGATIHKLSRGLDSGPIIAHARPEPCADAFEFSMGAVRAAHTKLIEVIRNGSYKQPGIPQDRSLELRYTKNADFTDAVADEFMRRESKKLS